MLRLRVCTHLHRWRPIEKGWQGGGVTAFRSPHQGQIRAASTQPLADEESPTSTPDEPGNFTKFVAGEWPRAFSKAAITAPMDFNRWLAVPSSFLVQLSIGSMYAFSMWNAPLTRDLGVVAASSADWSLSEVLPVFSTAAISLGFTTFFLGPWAERAGPRFSAIGAAVTYSSAFALSSAAVQLHSLPLLHLGYGVLGGMGWGLGYISPVSTLMRWFPDRRGLATGLGLTAFGAGAALAAPVIQYMLAANFVAPDYLGTVADVAITLDSSGKMLAETGAGVQEVVVATTADLKGVPGDLAEGVYVAGTGSTGASTAFLTLAGAYGASMLVGAAGNRTPHPDWKPAGWTPPSEDSAMIAKNDVDHVTALKTPQFYLLWTAVMGNAVAGMTLLSAAKTTMGDVFGAALPAVVTGAFTTKYVAGLSSANSAGRLGWSAFSDYLGRKNTYFLFGAGIPIAASIPLMTSSFSENPSTMPLYLFYGGTLVMISFYGGLFSTLPAYIADLFGQRHAGAIHGRVLTAWSAAALVGPNMLGYLRESSYDDAVRELTSRLEPGTFEKAFGAPVERLEALVEAKTVTIPRLMELVPVGTTDPTPILYNTTMYGIGGMLSVALLANYLISPIDPKFHMSNTKSTPEPSKE